MKYIRTKDGRILEYRTDSVLEATNDYFQINYDKDIKIANTIEELCDEFVAVNKKYNCCTLTNICKDKYYAPKIPMYYTGESTHDFVDDYIKSGNEIYGAIWTDKGLIYVAKMNKKGELELL